MLFTSHFLSYMFTEDKSSTRLNKYRLVAQKKQS